MAKGHNFHFDFFNSGNQINRHSADQIISCDCPGIGLSVILSVSEESGPDGGGSKMFRFAQHDSFVGFNRTRSNDKREGFSTVSSIFCRSANQ